MKVKVSEASGIVLDWMVAKCEGDSLDDFAEYYYTGWGEEWYYTTEWAQGGPIIEREDITVIRLENKSVPNDEGFWQGVYAHNWGAVFNARHGTETVYGPQGDDWGQCYSIDASDIVEGPTPLIAAMRCYVASKLGDEVEVPNELIGE